MFLSIQERKLKHRESDPTKVSRLFAGTARLEARAVVLGPRQVVRFA